MWKASVFILGISMALFSTAYASEEAYYIPTEMEDFEQHNLVIAKIKSSVNERHFNQSLMAHWYLALKKHIHKECLEGFFIKINKFADRPTELTEKKVGVYIESLLKTHPLYDLLYSLESHLKPNLILALERSERDSDLVLRIEANAKRGDLLMREFLSYRMVRLSEVIELFGLGLDRGGLGIDSLCQEASYLLDAAKLALKSERTVSKNRRYFCDPEVDSSCLFFAI